MADTKQCSKCNRSKPVTDFYRSSSNHKVLMYCGTCRASRREYSHRVGFNRRQKFGLDLEDLAVLRTAQGNKCRVCKQPLGAKFHVDHNHITNRVCALLCHNCNTGIGKFRESGALLQRAADYAKRTGRP